MAEKLDFEKDSPLRAEAGLLYALHELSDEGHVYYPTENLFEVASDLLKIEADLVLRSARDRLNEEKRIVTELIRIDGGHMSVTYLAGYHLAEVQAASRLRILSRALSSLRPVKVDAAIGWAEEKSGLKLAKRQKEAVASALTGGVGYGAVF
ncbi:MAG: hypothetical protein IJR87_10840 [Bacteroidaceae bacterium]|nr:hypothetical protein [Bacteroidaceae bacterium]